MPPPFFAAVGRLWYLQLQFDRWAIAVEILQGQRNTEIRAYILIRATWAAWRVHHRHISIKTDLTTRATAVIVGLRRAAILRGWREVAGQLQVWRKHKAAVVEWGRRRHMENALSGESAKHACVQISVCVILFMSKLLVFVDVERVETTEVLSTRRTNFQAGYKTKLLCICTNPFTQTTFLGSGSGGGVRN